MNLDSARDRLASLQWRLAFLALVGGGLIAYLLRRHADRGAKIYEALSKTTQQLKADISRRHELQQQLDLLQAAVTQTSDLVTGLNSDGRIIYVNEAICSATGYAAEELLSMHIWELDPVVQKADWPAAFEQVRRSGGLIVQGAQRRKSGESIPVEIAVRFVKTESGEYSFGFARDVSERNRNREQLERSWQQYRDVVDNIGEGVGLTDLHERFLFSNSVADAIFGVAPDSLVGRPLNEFVEPDTMRLVRDETARRQKGETSTYDLTIVRPSGEKRLINITARPRTSDDGRYVCTFGIFRDVTEERAAQEEHRRMQERLQTAERMESLGLLAGGVAHDLNNMLGPLVGYPDLIAGQLPEGSPAIKWVRQMGRSAESAAEVIQDLLTLARRGRYQMQRTFINDVIREYIDSPAFERLLQRNPGISFTQNLDARVGPIDGSAAHLAKVFMNVITNAFEATSPGGSVSVTTFLRQVVEPTGLQNQIEPGEYVVFCVRDTGHGIPADDLAKIFEPYYSKKKMGASGSGLGLAVVHGIVKDHSGYYDVSSEVGTGTQFLLYFPPDNRTVTVANDPEQTITTRLPRSVFVVGDNPGQRELVASMLESLNLSVTSSALAGADLTFDTGRCEAVAFDIPLGACDAIRPVYQHVRLTQPGTPILCFVEAAEMRVCDTMLNDPMTVIVRTPCRVGAIREALQSLVTRVAGNASTPV
ncbi:MAG: PAS domain S-box protein [candidate division Zixibacteria bacterium]|nr:PAS domain S-box protein [candidate division Zixibacteria bacterium]